MQFSWDNLGNKLVKSAELASKDVVLVSPFIKLNAIKKIIETLSADASIKCYTRWRCDEIVQGISDIEIWDLLNQRKNSQLFLIHNLHSKYYRFDSQIFIGSSNLTKSGLNWSPTSNFETLINLSDSDLTQNDFEFQLSLLGKVVDQKQYERTADLVEKYRLENPNIKLNFEALYDLAEINLDSDVNSNNFKRNSIWAPVTRSPEILFDIYSGNLDAISKTTLVGALDDLGHLDLPSNLRLIDFNLEVKHRLLMEPLLEDIDNFLIQSRRFGEMRELLEKLSISDASHSWQTLMRWLLFFAGDLYQSKTANYSEIFSKKTE